MAVRCAMYTNTGIDYYKNLSLCDFISTVKDIAEVLKEKEG